MTHSVGRSAVHLSPGKKNKLGPKKPTFEGWVREAERREVGHRETASIEKERRFLPRKS